MPRESARAPELAKELESTFNWRVIVVFVFEFEVMDEFVRFTAGAFEFVRVFVDDIGCLGRSECGCGKVERRGRVHCAGVRGGTGEVRGEGPGTGVGRERDRDAGNKSRNCYRSGRLPQCMPSRVSVAAACRGSPGLSWDPMFV